MGATGSTFTVNPGVGPDNKVTWPKSAAFSGTYEVQTSSDLTNWTPAPGAAVSDTGTAVACDLSLLTPVAGKVFIRLMVMPN